MASKHIIGIDLGGTNLKIALLDISCRIKHKFSLSTSLYTTKESLIEAIVESVYSILAKNSVPIKNIKGLGLGLPGPIDHEKGMVHFFPNIPGWKEVNLRAILEKRLKIPVFVDNDANVMAFAEYKLGAARGAKNAVCLTLGTGVGAGLILDGRLFRGSSYAAGEIGHMPLNSTGPECNCGGIACLETYVGNRRISLYANKLFKKEISLEDVSALAYKGDKKAVAVWDHVGLCLGLALVQVVNLLNPDCIVIGGGVANAGSILFDRVKETIFTRAMLVQARTVNVRKAELGNDAGMIGAGLIVLNN